MKKLEELFMKASLEQEPRPVNLKRSQAQKLSWIKNRRNKMYGINKSMRRRLRKHDLKNDFITNDLNTDEGIIMDNFSKLLNETSMLQPNFSKSDKISIEDMQQDKIVVDKTSIDDLGVTAEMLNFEVFLLDNLEEFNVSNISSEEVEKDNMSTEYDNYAQETKKDYYFDIELENNKVVTVYFTIAKENLPVMVIVNDKKEIKKVKLSENIINSEGNIDFLKTEFIPLKDIKEMLNSLKSIPEHYGYRLDKGTTTFYKKYIKNYKNITKEQKKAFVNSKYFDFDTDVDEDYKMKQPTKMIKALDDFNKRVDKKEDEIEVLTDVSQKNNLTPEEAKEMYYARKYVNKGKE